MQSSMLLVVLALSLMCIAPTVQADDTLMGESGHSVFPIDTDEIRMEYEHVVTKMDDHKWSGIAGKVRRANVRCEFLFENTSNEVIRAKVGFPGNDFNDFDQSESDLHDFTTTVDGRVRTVEVKRQILKEDRYDGKQGAWSIITYRNWYLLEVEFPPKKTVRITNAYWVIPSGNTVDWQIEYVLRTGANWKGTIGQAIIEVEYVSEQDLRSRVLDIKPLGYVIKGKRIIWDLREIEPKENITIVEKWLRQENAK